MRCKEIAQQYPMMIEKIYKLARYRPPRTFRTNVLYVHGPSGMGKTTSIYSVLKYLRDQRIISFYCKVGGLSKFCDGYDNDDVMWIDDPISVSARGDLESVQRFKNIMSTGDVLVEVKYGTMVFDSPLIIISSNMHPQDMAITMGAENIEPMYRRFTDTVGAVYIDNRSKGRERLRLYLLKVIKHQFDLDYNPDDIYSRIPTMKYKTFTHITL